MVRCKWSRRILAGTCEDRVLAVERNRADRPFHSVGIQLDAVIVEERDQAVPVLGDVFEGLTDWGFGRHPGAICRDPNLKCPDDRL